MADREESWRRSALMTHHLCPSAGQRNHRHGAIDLPTACSEFRRQLLGEVGRLELRREVRLKSLREKMRRFRLERSWRKKRGGGSNGVLTGGEKALQREPQLGGDLEVRQLRRGRVGVRGRCDGGRRRRSSAQVTFSMTTLHRARVRGGGRCWSLEKTVRAAVAMAVADFRQQPHRSRRQGWLAHLMHVTNEWVSFSLRPSSSVVWVTR
jgi:hypothetical protein